MKLADTFVIGLSIIACVAIGAFATGHKSGLQEGRWQCPKRVDEQGNKLVTTTVFLKTKEVLCVYSIHGTAKTYGQVPAEAVKIQTRYVGATQ